MTWLMTFGAKVEVLEPEEVRDIIRRNAEEILKSMMRRLRGVKDMAFDYKKEYKEFYMPKGTPSIVTVPKINYIAVRGSGNPNDEDGEYKQAIGLLYGIAFTIK